MHPVLFHLGSFPVYSYGVLLFFALLTGVFVASRELSKHDVDQSRLYALAAAIAVAGLIGSRLFYVLGHLSEFSGRWSRVFDINTVGLVYYGGLVAALPVGIYLMRRFKMPSGTVAGAIGLALPLSIAIARVGCFLNGCCGGKPSGLPWAVTFPGSSTPVHPTQLYEAVLDLAVFALLLFVGTRYLEGWDLLLVSLAGYAVVRFLVEFYRQHADPHAALFFQGMSAAIFVACAAALAIRLSRHPARVERDSGARGQEDSGGSPGRLQS